MKPKVEEWHRMAVAAIMDEWGLVPQMNSADGRDKAISLTDFSRAAQIIAERLEPKWISVDERLPDYDVDVLVWARDWQHVYLGYWRHSDEWIGRQRAEDIGPLPSSNPTHWMPLPKGPGEEKCPK